MLNSVSLLHRLRVGVCFIAAVSVWQTAVAQDVPPSPEMPMPVTESPDLAADAASVDTPTWDESLMFPEKDVSDLMAIYRAYLDSLAAKRGESPVTAQDEDVAKKTLERLAGISEPEDIDEEIYKLSLNSILYNNPRDWSIWVNGKRHSRKEAMEGFTIGTSNIEVTAVRKGQITYVWTPQPQSFDLVQERWDEKQQRKNAKVENSQIASGEQVSIDAIGQIITVTMRPNQTFYSEYMSVMEGSAPVRAPVATGGVEANPSGEAGEVLNGSTPRNNGMTGEPVGEGEPNPAYTQEPEYVAPNEETPLYESGMEPM